MSGPTSPPASELVGGDPSVELSSNRTSLSFERTRMSADRTLMSVVRTSLSLISFGFTIHQVFQKVPNLQGGGGRRLGLALLILGVGMLVMGIVTHAAFRRQLAARRERLHGLHLMRRSIPYQATPTYVVAVLLLAVGLLAIANVAFKLMS